jgi:hypothetical protein
VKIDLISSNSFAPGMSGVVKISFIEELINPKDLHLGMRFTFDEGLEVLGEGEILKIANG